MMAFGLMAANSVLSIALLVAFVSWLGIYPLSVESIFAMMGAGFLLAIGLIFGAVFTFPYKTMGHWPRTIESEESD
jgi:hypothetical protein